MFSLIVERRHPKIKRLSGLSRLQHWISHKRIQKIRKTLGHKNSIIRLLEETT